MLEGPPFFALNGFNSFQTGRGPCGGSGRLSIGLDAPGLQSPIQVWLFMALDNCGRPLQRSQSCPAPLSLV